MWPHDQRSTGRRALTLHAPETLEEAADLLARHHGNVRLGAGCTYVMLMAAHGEVQPEHLVGLHRIPGLDQLEPGRVGALTTLRHLERGPRTGAERALTMAAAVTAGPLVRTLGTVGGNVGFADGDVVPALMALDAEAHFSDGTAMPVARYVADRPPDRILTGFTYDATQASGATVKLSRRGMDWPVVTVSVVVRRDADDGTVTHAQVAAQALAATPVHLPAVAAVLVDSQGEAEAVEYAAESATHRIEVRSDAEASAPYRRRVAPAVVARALTLALEAGPDGDVPLEEARR